MLSQRARPPSLIRIAWLMADYPLGYTPLFFGQFSLLADFARHWKSLPWGRGRVPVEQYYLGSRVAGPNRLLCPDPTLEGNAYLAAVEKLCAGGEPLFALANFIHKDSIALGGLCVLRQRYNNFHLIVILHCTRDEFIGDQRNVDGVPVGKRAAERTFRLANFQSTLPTLGREGGADAFVAVSQAALHSYTPEIDGGVLPASRMRVVPNGVDTHHYRPCSERQRLRKRAEVGLYQGWTVGISSRWTQAKGSHILEALLDRLEFDPRWSFLLPALAHDQLFQFLASVPERYPRLYASRRIRLFLDVSHLRRSPLAAFNIEQIQMQYMQDIASQPAVVRQVFERAFVGFLEYPVYELLDLYLRPSVAEAFGLGPVEAYLSGVPVLSSNRDGLAAYILPEHQIAFGEHIRLLGDKQGAPPSEYSRQVQQAGGCFYQKMNDRESWRIPGEVLRRRVIDLGLTTSHMLRSYNRLLLDLI